MLSQARGGGDSPDSNDGDDRMGTKVNTRKKIPEDTSKFTILGDFLGKTILVRFLSKNLDKSLKYDFVFIFH